MNRVEYANAVRDLLGLEVDPSGYLPVDDASSGFDNVAGALSISPALIEGYLSAAGKISRSALGMDTAPQQKKFIAPQDLSQEGHMQGLPSGTRGGMLIKHYPELFAGEPEMAARAERFAARAHELVSFLTDVLGVERVHARFDGTVTYHDSCSSLRELGVKTQPRRLLAGVEGLSLVELDEAETCCGFGGTFAAKYGELSNAVVARKAEDIRKSGAQTVLAGDLGCLLNIVGKLQREGSPVKARHVAEVLAGMAEGPAIGEPQKEPGR